jgi:hypothetical protein
MCLPLSNLRTNYFLSYCKPNRDHPDILQTLFPSLAYMYSSKAVKLVVIIVIEFLDATWIFIPSLSFLSTQIQFKLLTLTLFLFYSSYYIPWYWYKEWVLLLIQYKCPFIYTSYILSYKDTKKPDCSCKRRMGANINVGKMSV